ncbi:TatD family hydrolase [Larsenimonas rhizosphaerae]|uniref:TatD family hydrolase n=1 Tax=Larsenimonas rhizosphaerae TaxID=2944682 RepID=A0AA41ZG20_9GAMM|nr:TatD family hydrolase [Larsenimonas rhizosphaerae]MCM2131180.1 TatD family hydrolase [Larsenimonas rhizosphaerae]MCX2523885.1 TatD family hydrolase [Larsenimonas rhizosphaerae]
MLPEALSFTADAPLVDTGANLTHESFRADIDDVLGRAHAAGVTTLVLTGTDQQGIEDALALCERETPVALYATAGLHPHHAADWTPELARFIEQAASHSSVVAIGECGLDYHRDYSSRTDQRRALEAQLELAARTGKPLFLHERDAGADMADILKQWRDDLTQAVVHCFTGERETLHRYLDLDLHIGQTGWICDERRGHHLRSLVADIPANRLMIETDCPYLLPRNLPAKLKGRRHEPALLPWIARELAYWRGVSEQTLSEQTTATARAFFTLPLTD